MENARLYSRIPQAYNSQGTAYGSNSEIYRDIISELEVAEDDIAEVRLALYLFNNIHLYNHLLRLARKGAHVVVISLPLRGYDARKSSEAISLYGRLLQEQEVELRIFPHMYMWYGAQYAEGGASYSFHIKAGTVSYKNGTTKVFLTSGNLAPGDPTHSETAVFIDGTNSSPYVNSFKLFMSAVETRSKPYVEYADQVKNLDRKLQHVFDFAFVGAIGEVDYSSELASCASFTGPFIKVGGQGSNHWARKKMIETMQTAKKRLFVCGQHVHDLAPFDGYKGDSLVSAFVKVKSEQSTLDARVLKQVASSGLADKRRAAFVEAHLFHSRVPQRVNRLVHDKFIVVDNQVFVTTANLTPTQFGWGHRNMELKTGVEDLSTVSSVILQAKTFFTEQEAIVGAVTMQKKKGGLEAKAFKEDIFSEVNGFIKIEDPRIADQLATHFNALWTHPQSTEVTVPW